MTSDNASNNDTAMKEVAKVIDEDGTHWLPGSRCIRCQKHILNLAACHFVDAVAPTPCKDCMSSMPRLRLQIKVHRRKSRTIHMTHGCEEAHASHPSYADTFPPSLFHYLTFVGDQHGLLPSFTQYPAQLRYVSRYISSLPYTRAQNSQNRTQLSLCRAQCTAPLPTSIQNVLVLYHFNHSGSTPPLSLT
jgi:hypothetical protein